MKNEQFTALLFLFSSVISVSSSDHAGGVRASERPPCTPCCREAEFMAVRLQSVLSLTEFTEKDVICDLKLLTVNPSTSSGQAVDC